MNYKILHAVFMSKIREQLPPACIYDFGPKPYKESVTQLECSKALLVFPTFIFIYLITRIALSKASSHTSLRYERFGGRSHFFRTRCDGARCGCEVDVKDGDVHTMSNLLSIWQTPIERLTAVCKTLDTAPLFNAPLFVCTFHFWFNQWCKTSILLADIPRNNIVSTSFFCSSGI